MLGARVLRGDERGLDELATHAATPTPLINDNVLDMCSPPGGKRDNDEGQHADNLAFVARDEHLGARCAEDRGELIERRQNRSGRELWQQVADRAVRGLIERQQRANGGYGHNA